MSITKKIAVVSLAALTMGAVFSANQAQARGWGVGLGIGLGVGALVGAAAASSYGPAYVVTPGYRPCHWVRQFDAYGNYVGKACVY
jgi:4-amino-4-deoxy-L-arabinose transferase-like glycosyltransferase